MKIFKLIQNEKKKHWKFDLIWFSQFSHQSTSLNIIKLKQFRFKDKNNVGKQKRLYLITIDLFVHNLSIKNGTKIIGHDWF